MSRTEQENEKREKELVWDKQGGGKIDFGGHIGVIHFPCNRDKPLDDSENYEIRERYVLGLTLLESSKNSVWKEGGERVENPTFEEYSKSGFMNDIKKIIREQKSFDKELKLRKESFSVSNIEELKDIMERYRKDKTFRKGVKTNVPTPNKIGEILTLDIHITNGGWDAYTSTSLRIKGDRGYFKSFKFPLKQLKNSWSDNQKECFENIVKYFEENIFLSNPTP